MKYRIFDKKTGKYCDDSAIVTQEGKVAFWDESQGWEEGSDQDNYIIEVIESSAVGPTRYWRIYQYDD